MPFDIPRSFHEAFGRFVRMSEAERAALVLALSMRRRPTDARGAARDLLGVANPDRADCDFVWMLSGMIAAYQCDLPVPFEEFAAAVIAAAERAGDARLLPADGNWGPVRRSIADVVRVAQELLDEHEARMKKRPHESPAGAGEAWGSCRWSREF